MKNISKKSLTICWFGTYDPREGRNRIYISGLEKLGHSIVHCRDTSSGIKKFFRLWRKHRQLGEYDALVVGYPGHAVVWLARIISRTPVIFDAGWTMTEGVVFSRGQRGLFGLNSLYIACIDWFAVHMAHVILVESHAQKSYFEQKFRTRKCQVLYTGADNAVFYADQSVTKRGRFTAIFQGRFLPEAGIRHIIEAAKILEKENVDVVIAGLGYLLEKDISARITESGCKNITLIIKVFSDDELRQLMLSCHVSLGQFENHIRLERTIPHKCFESLALGLPYVTARTGGVSEILRDGETCIFVNPADPKDLAEKIIVLKNDAQLREKIGHNGHELYQREFTPMVLAQKVVSLLENIRTHS